MGKVVVLLHLSLDASTGEKGEMGWIKLSKELFANGSLEIANADTGLYGPETFKMMEAVWPQALSHPQPKDPYAEHTRWHAEWYKNAKKIVFSRKIKSLENKEARLISENIPAE